MAARRPPPRRPGRPSPLGAALWALSAAAALVSCHGDDAPAAGNGADVPRSGCIGSPPFCELRSGPSGDLDDSGAAGRRLAAPVLPNTTKLLLSAGAGGRPVATEEVLVAEPTIKALTIRAGAARLGLRVTPGGNYTASVPARLRILPKRAVTLAADGSVADRPVTTDTCFNSTAALAADMVGGDDFVTPQGIPLNFSGGAWATSSPLFFKKSGEVRFCLSVSGDFASREDTVLLNLTVTVLGLGSSCSGRDCLGNASAACRPGATGSACALPLYESVIGSSRKASWSAAFAAAYSSAGEAASVTPAPCGGAAATPKLAAGAAGSGVIAEVQGAAPALNLSLLAAAGPATAAACYCPGAAGESCAAAGDFVQQVGLIFVYTAALCDPRDPACATSYRRVLAGQRFALQVRCPPAGCRAGGGSRVKLVAPAAGNEAPAWDAANGCRGAAHEEGWLAAVNCLLPSRCRYSGGVRQDYRQWGNASAWWALELEGQPGMERFDVRSAARTSDVCYCDGDCDALGAVWFKVGDAEVVPVSLGDVAGGGHTALASAGVPGALGLAPASAAGPTLGYAPGGVVKLVANATRSAGASQCQAPYGEAATSFTGLLTQAEALERVGALLGSGELVFTGDAPRTVAAAAGGVVAVCYCSALGADGGCASGDFFNAGLMTVHGPAKGQTLVVTRGGLFSISFVGFGLQATDKLSLSTTVCGSSGEAPQVLVGCPGACASAAADTALAVGVLSDATVGCDDMWQGCGSARVTGLAPHRDGTELTFAGDPLLGDGDEIVLGDGITGGSAEQLATLKGRFPYRLGDGSYSPDRSYIVAHAVAPGASSATRRLRLDFRRGGAVPNFTVAAEGARWVRHSRAATSRELLAPAGAATSPFHVCWSPAGAAAKVDVGTVRFEDPPAFPKALLAPVAPISGAAVPAILAFQTGARAYPVADGGTALLVRFTSSAVSPRMADGSAPGAGVSRASASQAMCGTIILEAWSRNALDGFPLPRRCRFSPSYTQGSATITELEIEFEPRNGLMGNSAYQLVLNIAAVPGLAAGAAAARVVATEDLLLRPNSAVEAADAALALLNASAIGAASTEADAWTLGSAELLGGSAHTTSGGSVNLLGLQRESTGGLTLNLKLTAGAGKTVSTSEVLRVALRPFTQWSLSSASVSCVSSSRSCSPTSALESLDAQVGWQPNVVRFTGVEVSSATTPTVALSTQARVVGGFFSARPALVVSQSTGAAHQYLAAASGVPMYQSVAPYAMLVGLTGEGNDSPFVGTDNDLFIRVLLAAGLPQAGKLSIVAPAFYSNCTGPRALPADLRLKAAVPSAAGVLRQGSWVVGASPCRWDFTASAPLPAGSSLYVQVGVRNPEDRVTATNATNVWRAIATDSVTPMEADFRKHSLAPSALVTKLAVVHPMASAQVVPGSFSLALGGKQNVSVFLAVGVTVSPTASVQVEAPEGFDFGEACRYFALKEASLYRYGGGGMHAEVDRLPRPTGCVSSARSSLAAERNRVRISLDRPLINGTRIGFDLEVRNPPAAFLLRHQAQWAIETLAADGQAVERSQGLAAHVDRFAGRGASQAWGLYTQDLVWGATISVAFDNGWESDVRTEAQGEPRTRYADLSPFLLARRTTYVTFSSIKLPREITAPCRLTLPMGFEFETEPLLAGRYYKRSPTGATEEWPGEFPALLDEVYALWDMPMHFRTYSSTGFRAKYGFSIGLRLPWWPRTSNKFFLEFGYGDEALAPGDDVHRPFAMVIPGPSQIKVIRGAEVDYLTSQKSFIGNVRLVLTTATMLLEGEGLMLRAGPISQTLRCTCPPAGLLNGLTCSMIRGKVDDEMMVELTVVTTLVAGTYVFPVSCTNPEAAMDLMTWSFASYQDIKSFPQVSVVDSAAEAPGFSTKYALGRLETWPGGPSAGFDPRPLRPSGTILAFMLHPRNTTVNASTARIRAPEGTFFSIDCLDNLVLESSQVMGGGIAREPFTQLPPVYLCRGARHIMYLTWLEPLKATTLYALRVKSVNPAEQPTDHYWTMEVDDQASGLLPAAPVQRFSGVDLTVSVPALRVPGSTVRGSGGNRLRLTFSPTVPARSVNLFAPPGYDFGTGPEETACKTMRLQGRALDEATRPLLVVPPLLQCAAATENISFELGILVGYAYDLTLDVLAPASPPGPETFRLFSFVAGGGLGDESWVPAPALRPGVTSMSVERLSGGEESGVSVVSKFSVAFGTTVEANDRLVLTFPPMFAFPNMDAASFACPVQWMAPEVGPAGICKCTIRKERGKDIKRCAVTFFVNSTGSTASNSLVAPWPAGSLLSFNVTVVNPSAVPSLYDNMLVVSLFSSGVLEPRSIGHQRGWPVLPQLADPRITFAKGTVLRAGASGATLFLDFTPSNDATIVRLTGESPSGWDFSSSRVCGIPGTTTCVSGAEGTAASALELRNIEVVSGTRVPVEILGVKLADVGGTASFALETFRQDQTGSLLAVDGGKAALHLPGDLRAHYVKLRTATGGVLDPTDALWAQLPPRVGIAEAAIIWRFEMTMPAEVGDYLLVRAETEPVAFDASLVSFERVAADGSTGGAKVQAKLELVAANELRFNLEETLPAGAQQYYIILSGTVTGALKTPGTSFFNVSVCRSGLPFPVNTNDIILPTGGLGYDRWSVASPVAFEIADIKTAPLTQIQLVGLLPPSEDYTTVDLLAPLLTEILAPCYPSKCERVDPDVFGTGQNAAVNLELGDIKLMINLPVWWQQGAIPGGRNRWVVLLRGPDGNALAAPRWGYSDRLSLRLMPASVAYPAVAGQADATITVSFQIGRPAAAVIFEAAACTVDIVPPLGYALKCNNSDDKEMFRVVAAPNNSQSVCSEGLGNRVIVSMTSVRFSTRDVVFAFGVDVPMETPPASQHYFQVTIASSSKNTADSNTQVPGIDIPAPRLRSRVSWQVSGFESLAWLQAWAAAARDTNALGRGIADGLGVANTTVRIEDVQVRLDTGGAAGRRLSSALQGVVNVTFSVAVRLASESSQSFAGIRAAMLNPEFTKKVTESTQVAVSSAGLYALPLSGCKVGAAQEERPPRATAPELIWRSSKANSTTMVSLSVDFLNATEGVAAVLIVLPPTFRHQVRRLEDFTFSAPLQHIDVADEEGSWIDTRAPEMLRILLSAGSSVEAGAHTFGFPVAIPAKVPFHNVWYLCLCSARTCEAPTNASVLTSFVMPGFNIGEIHPSTLIAGAPRRALAWLVLALSVVPALRTASVA